MDDLNNFGGFKKFVKSATRIIDKISITTGGALGFSTSFSNDHKLQGYSGVVLYWNDQSQDIGVRFVATEEGGSLKLKANNNGNGYTVNAKSFFVTNRIDTAKKHGRYEYITKPLSDYNLSSKDSLYIISLKDKNYEQGGDELQI